MSDRPARPRGLLFRFGPIALVLLGLAIVNHFYSPQPVALLLQLPSEADEGRPGLDVRILRPDGKLAMRIEQRVRASDSHTVVARTRLPRGRYRVEAAIDGSTKKLCKSVDFDGEPELEVLLERCEDRY